MGEFLVSVIIPVFNAAAYVTRAVESVVGIPEAGEVLLIDDGSTDNSLEVCRHLAQKYEKVKVFRHEGGINKGAAASRNLGIINARYEFIAFLDADDYYLPNRFSEEKTLFQKYPEADGVYGCNKAAFENEEAKQKFLKVYEGELTTLHAPIPPNKLFKTLLYGGYGRFHTSAITLRKRAFEKTGLFNTRIRYVEDTEMWLKLSLKSVLIPGSITVPVSIRWVHDANSIHQRDKVKQYSQQMYQELFDWALQQSFSFETKNDFFIVLHKFANGGNYPVKRLFWEQVRRNPSMLLSSFFYKKVLQLYFTR